MQLESSLARRDGRLKADDRVLQINGFNVEDEMPERVDRIIRVRYRVDRTSKEKERERERERGRERERKRDALPCFYMPVIPVLFHPCMPCA